MIVTGCHRSTTHRATMLIWGKHVSNRQTKHRITYDKIINCILWTHRVKICLSHGGVHFRGKTRLEQTSKRFCYCQILILMVHGPVSPEQSCNHNWVYPVIQPYHFPLIIVESSSAENLSNSFTLSTSLLYSLNNSPTSLILSSSTLHSINFFFSDGSNLALLSPNETASPLPQRMLVEL